MEIIELLKSEYISIIFGGIGGIATAFLSQKVLNKRGLISYFVNHNKIGMSSQDSVFGDVNVTWNGNQVEHLYLSTIELKNESLNDYEIVIIKTYTNDTLLLTESTQVKGTPDILYWTESYQKQLAVKSGSQATEAQIKLHNSQREYLIPVFNRGQEISITYLNSAHTNMMPSVWLSTTVKGVKVKFQVPQQQIHGVSQPNAAMVGVLLGFLLLIPLVSFVDSNWAIAIASIVYGFIVQLPGVFIIKTYRKLRELIGG